MIILYYFFCKIIIPQQIKFLHFMFIINAIIKTKITLYNKKDFSVHSIIKIFEKLLMLI